MNRISLLYTTAPNEQEAKKLANAALSNKLAACVNIIPNGISIYLWKGKIEQNTECYLLFKTTADLVNELEKLIIQNHYYELPAILKFDAETYEAFFSYIKT